LCYTPIKLSHLTTEVALAESIGQFVTGSVDGVSGGTGAPYSVVQSRTENLRLVRDLQLLKNDNVNVTHVWHKIWGNVLRVALAELDINERGRMTVWAAGPNDPAPTVVGGVGIVSQNRAMNNYRHYQAKVRDGSHVLIEVSMADRNLIAYLNFFLGGVAGMLNFMWPESGGVRITPHLDSRSPAAFSYSYQGTDVPENVNLPVSGLGIAGLPDAGIPVAGQAFAGWDHSLSRQALLLLGAQLAVPDDCEAGLLIALVDCFGENFNGVDDSHEVGSSLAKMGYSCLLTRGETRIAGGSTACTILSPMRTSNVDVALTLDRINAGLVVTESVAKARVAIEPLIYVTQLALRQAGVVPAVLFPRQDFAQMHRAGVPVPPDDLATRMSLHQAMCVGGDDHDPSPVMAMTALMMHKVLNCRIPVPYLMGNVGTTDLGVQSPLWGELNLGEITTSVHPATFGNGVLAPAAQALVGVPHGLGDQYVAFHLRPARNGYYVQGHPNTRLVASAGVTRFEGEGGIAMLGHSIHLRRAAPFSGTDLSIMVSNITDEDNRISIQGSVVPHESYERWAVSRTDDFARTPGVDPQFAMLDLFADFNIMTSEDLSVFLSGPNGYRFAAGSNGRRRWPGYMWAEFLQRPALGLGGALVMFQAPKRRRLVAHASAPVAES